MDKKQIINELTELIDDMPIELHLNSVRTTKLKEFLKSVIARLTELTEENERLRKRVVSNIIIDEGKLEEIKNECLERVELDVKAIRADTVRKMQERLNDTKFRMCGGGECYIYAENVDQIAKEMLEGLNDQRRD